MIRTMICGLLMAATPVAAQDVPYDYSGMSGALTSSQIDNNVLGDVAKADRPARSPRRRAPPARKRPATNAQTEAACAESTRILKTMGIPPHPDCR